MTILQPHKRTPLLNYVLGILVVLVFLSALSLVYMYNSFVDMEHHLGELKADMQNMETESALVRDKILSLSSEAEHESIAAARGLVKEKSPTYLTINTQWPLASR